MRSRYLSLRYALPALALLACAGCSGQEPAPQAAAPSPTIAAVGAQPAPAAQPVARPTPSPARPASRPTAAPPAVQAATAADPSMYLWPAYLPPGMRPSPAESRVARDGEPGMNGFGFYVVTLNAGGQKLAVGGGDLPNVLPLAGGQRSITVGQRTASLITAGERREIVFDVPKGKLFIYGAGLSEAELLKVADSLQPIDVRALRQIAGVS